MKQSLHEKKFNNAKKLANQHLDKFRKMELDLKEAVENLDNLVKSIDAEMDSLAVLRIKVQGQMAGHEQALKGISNFLGGVEGGK